MMIVPYSVAFAANSNKKTITVDGIIYQLFDDQTAEVYKYEGTPVNVIVPSSVSDGTTTYNVTVISLLAFKGCNSLQSRAAQQRYKYWEFGIRGLHSA